MLYARRLEQLDGLRRGRALHGLARQTTLAEFAREHLLKKAEAGRTTERWLAQCERQLARAIAFFGGKRELGTLTVAEVGQWRPPCRRMGSPAGARDTAWTR